MDVAKMTDTELLDWLENNAWGAAIVHDDVSHWAVATMGAQDIQSDPPGDLWTTHLIEKHAWQPSIRDAIRYIIKAEGE